MSGPIQMDGERLCGNGWAKLQLEHQQLVQYIHEFSRHYIDILFFTMLYGRHTNHHHSIPANQFGDIMELPVIPTENIQIHFDSWCTMLWKLHLFSSFEEWAVISMNRNLCHEPIIVTTNVNPMLKEEQKNLKMPSDIPGFECWTWIRFE